ncbi:WD40 repeat protein [Kribbella orskensis]|uniref:WD40 repeat protein n=1 Tax=Kribbella orskensis TaxID=2512216 RepID=A0ABY2BJJ3_9ACTN|nr:MULTISPECIES: PD40 domain-containing protein [Kribbella]TCN40128.1 WD40 repeat protein [Kribbella sp. VKM Ac-2500]TCO22748.1 WD40 repeat protein [Kribbella orskensis]
MKRFRIACALSVLAVSLSLVSPVPANATFPARNGLIAFGADTGSGTQLFTVGRNGHDLRQITHGPGEATTPDWSADGEWLAYSLDECTIALVRADGTDQRVIPSQTPEGCETDPAFTPDGNHLVFERFDAIADDDAIWIMDLNGNGRRRIGTGPGGAATPEVSPDGRTITFLSFTPNDLTALFAMSIGGGAARQVTPTLYGIAFKHDWAPDGSRLVMSDNADDFDHPANLVTIRPDGTGLRYLTDLQTPDQRALAGGYSPDGKWITYRLEHGDQNALMIVRTDGQGAHAVLPFSSFRPRFIDWGPAAK